MIRSLILLVVLYWAYQSAEGQQTSSSAYVKRDSARKEVVVFVHGVTGDAKETWTNEKTKAYWPELLRNDETFANANVWVSSYFSPKLQKAQNVEELATKLGDEMRAQDVFKSHDRVYFIVHSMGGLITREMLTQYLPPANKVPMIFFFGTPSAGADLAGVVAAVSSNPQFANLRPFTRESDVASYSRRWLSTAENPKAQYPQRIWSFCSYEIQAFAAGKLIVNEGSATFLCSTSPRGAMANHVTMVKPDDTTAESYQYFVSAYKFVRSPEARFLAAANAITLHSVATPGIKTDSIQLRTASFSDKAIQVGCNQMLAGEERLHVELAPSQRIVAVEPSFKSTSGLLARSLSSTFDSSGSITVGYVVQGRPAHPVLGCRDSGRAQVGVQYLIEQR